MVCTHVTRNITVMKKVFIEMQTLRAGCSKAEPNIFAPRRPPSQGCRMAKILSAGDGHYLYLQTQFGEDRCMQISSYSVNSPTNKQTQPQTHKQTGPITIHYTSVIMLLSTGIPLGLLLSTSVRHIACFHDWIGGTFAVLYALGLTFHFLPSTTR